MTTGGLPSAEPPDEPVAGRYELGPVIGVGSSAVVRRGRDLVDGEPVAIKMFHSGATAHDRRQQRQEMVALSRLDHPGLVGLHDGGVEDGRPYVVTDLVDGPTLAERIRSGPVPTAEVHRLGVQLADALAHVHDGGVVHRDVKPANVLLGDGTAARLADFGISRTADDAGSTEAGAVVGTAAYLAPEQARGEQVGPPTDVYALGLVLLEALTARREYPGQAVESATARLHRRPDVPSDLPGGLTGVLRDMTDDDPARRPSAAEVAARLEARRPGRHALVEGPGGPPALAPLPASSGPRHARTAPDTEHPDTEHPAAPGSAVPDTAAPGAGAAGSIGPDAPRRARSGPARWPRPAAPTHRRPIPSRAAAPLAATVLVLAVMGGAVALLATPAPDATAGGDGATVVVTPRPDESEAQEPAPREARTLPAGSTGP